MIITRTKFSLINTVGDVIIPDTRFRCYSLEDVARALGVKIYGETAICAGRFKCRINQSKKFGRLLPLIYNLTDYSLADGHGASWTGIRIHNGVNHKHTDGCPLVGFKKSKVGIYEPAADELVKVLIEKYGVDKEFDIEIINKQAA